MGDNSRFDNEITITPPLTWRECRVTPGLENAQLRIDERVIDGAEGQARILTAPAIKAARHCFGPHLLVEIQAVIDSHPKHEFDGFIEEWLEPGYRELPRRYIVRGRKVLCVKAEWPAEQQQDERDACSAQLLADSAARLGVSPDTKCALRAGHATHNDGNSVLWDDRTRADQAERDGATQAVAEAVSILEGMLNEDAWAYNAGRARGVLLNYFARDLDALEVRNAKVSE